MYKSLDFFNFGPSFKKWIETLYNSPVVKIKKNNGHLSDEFKMTRGIRQGCPVSALIFILSIEILGLKIRQQDEIKGLDFRYPDKLVKTVQYADDCIAVLNDKNELCTVLNLISEYGKASGLTLNVSKCEGIWFGVDKTR